MSENTSDIESQSKNLEQKNSSGKYKLYILICIAYILIATTIGLGIWGIIIGIKYQTDNCFENYNIKNLNLSDALIVFGIIYVLFGIIQCLGYHGVMNKLNKFTLIIIASLVVCIFFVWVVIIGILIFNTNCKNTKLYGTSLTLFIYVFIYYPIVMIIRYYYQV